jgi:hypothetical protein
MTGMTEPGGLSRRIASAHRVFAKMLLNTLLLIIVLELVAGIVLATVTSGPVRDMLFRVTDKPNDLIKHHYLSLPYYAQQDWSEAYWREHSRAQRKNYYPYVIWRSPPSAGRFVNIEGGLRSTPGTNCGPDAVKVYVFGGSAMWGWGAPDWGTIPAYLQADLEAAADGPFCVVNYGENAYVSTQSLIQLQLLLEAGNVPDVVLFYDGVNEVFAGHQAGQPGVHQNLSEIATLFQKRGSPFLGLLRSSSSFRIAQLMSSQLGLSGKGSGAAPKPKTDIAELSDQIVDTYLKELEIVGALSEVFGFDYYFLWQPHILAGEKRLSDEEQEMLTGLSWVVDLNSELRDLFSRTYEAVAREEPRYEHLHFMAHVFDDVEAPIWIDTWGHVTPEGNRLISREISSLISEGLAKREP